LGSRVPRSGSAYMYIYVTIGEFVAFIMGWDLILENVIGAAGIANALSGYINVLFSKTIHKALESAIPMNINGLAPFPDFLAFSLIVFMSGN
jgi:solute carrier family 7 (cationic amino acid transporter), member 3